MQSVALFECPRVDRPPRVMELLIGGVCATAAAVWILPWLNSQQSTWGSILHSALIIMGLAASAVGVALRPRWSLGLVLASISAAQAALAISPDWDTIRMALNVAAVGALAASVCALLSRSLQRVVVSALILFHFGGILVAVTSVPPPYAAAPWIATQLWIRVYRPYFQFMYLFNAYHFYSPDPGPATLLWACVNYSDGSHQWVRMPNRREHMKDPLAVGYFRRLSITEATNQLLPVTPVPPMVVDNRALSGLSLGIPTPERIAQVYPGVIQYRPPTNYTRELLESYARRIAANCPSTDPQVTITGIKIYRVTHGLLTPNQVFAGKDPTDSSMYFPYFQGDFSADGQLQDPIDALLYWFIPIVKIVQKPVRPTDSPATGLAQEDDSLGYLQLHATTPTWKGNR